MPTIACQVSASHQDCLVAKNIFGNWNISLTHNQVSIGYHDAARYAQGAGLYFPHIPIPPGSTIVQAFLILRASESTAFTPCKAKILVEFNANPVPFTTLANYWARPRALVTTLMDYVGRPWAKDSLYASYDVRGHVQTAINIAGWAEGNPIVFFWNDHAEESYPGPGHEREAYSWNANPQEAPRLEISYELPAPPTPPPAWPLPVPPAPPRKGWCGTDLQYTYLDTGFTLVYYTDTPCHLWCRMTTTPPRKHSLPSYRRGLYLQGDIRFCFVVYEDNEQAEAGDTLVHTFVKDTWPICETRWFYFIGRVYGDLSPSESPIFEFHFPSPPPTPPPPLERSFIAMANNRTIVSTNVAWPLTWAGSMLTVLPAYGPPFFVLHSGAAKTVNFWANRAFLTFDMSALPVTAIIVNASLRLYVFQALRTSSAVFPYWQVTRGRQSDPVVTADWALQNPETEILGQVDYDDLTTGQYNTIPLNLIGIAHITPGGLATFCLRSQLDVENLPPPLGTNWAIFHSLQKGAGFWPVLTVQYYPA